MKILDTEEIISLLNEDFVMEIYATMIYVRNAFIMPKCDPSRITEAISIDLRGQLELQKALETEAVERYKQHIELIDDPEVVGVLKHILDEEKRHRKEFSIRLDKMEK